MGTVQQCEEEYLVDLTSMNIFNFSGFESH